jgi:hypothetical protein
MNPRLEACHDGPCRLCRAEIGALIAAGAQGLLVPRDCLAASFDVSLTRAAGIDRDVLINADADTCSEAPWAGLLESVGVDSDR